MPDQPLISDLKTGDTLLGYFLATDAAYKTTRNGSEYLELKLMDASGELKAFLWDLKAVEGEFSDLVPDVFVKVKGRLEEFQGRKQIRVEKVRFAPDSEVGDFSRFFPTSSRNAASAGRVASASPPMSCRCRSPASACAIATSSVRKWSAAVSRPPTRPCTNMSTCRARRWTARRRGCN